MKARIDTYKNNAAKAMKDMWYVVLVFTLIQIGVSIAVAQKNSVSVGGYSSATFSALWTMFLVVLFLVKGAQIVFKGRGTKVEVGFLIGSAAMLSQLFFVLMCFFFVLGTEAKTYNYDTEYADNAYGVFALFNTIIYLVWAIILSVHRGSVATDGVVVNSSYVNESEETMNPTYMNSSSSAVRTTEPNAGQEDDTRDL